MGSHLFAYGGGERKALLAVLIRLLNGEVGDALVEGVLGVRDRGRISSFLKRLREELGPFEREYSAVAKEDFVWLGITLESVLHEIATDVNRDFNGRSRFLGAGLRGPYAMAAVVRSSSSAVTALAEAPPDASAYFALALDTMASVLCDWVTLEDRAQRLAESHGVGELLRAADSISSSIASAVEAIDDVDARHSRTRADVVKGRYVRVIDERMPRPLVDRANELQLAASLVRGDHRTLAWVAPEKAGKSGLAYAIAHQSFADTDVVPFFIRQRDATSNSSPSFLFVTGAFLATIVGDRYGPPDGGGIDAVWGWRDLLERATYVARSGGRQLLLLIDGLDEERAHDGDYSVPSIASLIPDLRDLQALGLKVLVTSRPNPPVPRDVPEGHWLKQETSWTNLAPSVVAARAVDPSEIDALMSNETGRAIAGLVAAAGAPLTVADIADCLGIAVPVIRRTLESGTSRNLVSSKPTAGSVQYELGHESALVRIVQNLSPAHAESEGLRDRPDWPSIRDRTLKHFRECVLRAASRSAANGWVDSPPFLLTEAFLRLAQLDGAAAPLLAGWLVDAGRHRAQATSGLSARDSAEQIAEAARRWEVQGVEDLLELERVLVTYNQISPGGLSVPFGAVSACVLAGDLEKAFAVASAVVTRAGASKALMAVAEAAADSGDLALAQRALAGAETATRTISWVGARTEALERVADIYARLGSTDDARRVLGSLGLFPSPMESGDASTEDAQRSATLPIDPRPYPPPPSSEERRWIDLPGNARLAHLVDSREAALQMVRKAESTARSLGRDRDEAALAAVGAALLAINATDEAFAIYDELTLARDRAGDSAYILARAIDECSMTRFPGQRRALIDRYIPLLLESKSLDAESYVPLAATCRLAGATDQAELILRSLTEMLQSPEWVGLLPRDALTEAIVDEFIRLDRLQDAETLVDRLPINRSSTSALATIAAARDGSTTVRQLEVDASREANPFIGQSLWLQVAQMHADADEKLRSLRAVGRAWAAGGDYTCGWAIVESVSPGTMEAMVALIPPQ